MLAILMVRKVCEKHQVSVIRTFTGISTEDKTPKEGEMNHGNHSKCKKRQNKRMTKISNPFLKVPQLILLNRLKN